MNRFLCSALWFLVVFLWAHCSPIKAQDNSLLLGLTKCCPNNLVQYNTETGEVETIAEVGTAERVIVNIDPIFDEFGNVVGQDTFWTWQGDIFNANVGSGVLDKTRENIYFIRNFRIVKVSFLDGQVTELAPVEGVRELIGLENNSGRLFGSTSCCPNEIVTIEPVTGERSVIAEVGTAEPVIISIDPIFDEFGNVVGQDTLWSLQGDIFSSVSGPSLASVDGSRVFFIRNQHLLTVETLTGQLTEGAMMEDQRLLAYDEIEETLYFRTGCCPNKLQKYNLEEQILTTIAEIGTADDLFIVSFGGAIYDGVNERFYMRRNNKLLTVTMSGNTFVAENETLNELSIVGGVVEATRVGTEEGLLEITSGLTANPNPFSNQMELTLISTTNEHIRIEIYDLLGRRIESLYSGRLPIGQKRKFRFMAGRHPSGLYFVRYSGVSFSEVKTVILAK